MNIYGLVTILTASFVANSMAAPCQGCSELDERALGLFKPVYLTFKEIAQTITKLDEAQSSAGQSGKPDFNKSASLLNQLSMEADEAYFLLQNMGKEQLDHESVVSIGQSLRTSAEHVVAITNMVKKGKEWFEKNHVTKVVVNILRTNAYEFSNVYKELEQHVPPTVYGKYGKSITTFLCSIINAIDYLDPNATVPEGKEFCKKCRKNQKQYYKNGSFDNKKLAPAGMETCNDSASDYLYRAYDQKTIGTDDTKCEANQPSVFTSEPTQNALLL